MSDASNTTKLWMPIYVADYLADTCRLTTEQHGAYLLLIFDYWRNGALPDNDTVLAQVSRLTPDAWSMHGAVLRAFFVKGEDGLLHQKRIDAEITKAQLNREVSVTRAKKAAEARWSKNAPSIPPSNAPEMLEQCPSPSPTPTPIKTNTKAASAFVLPDWVDKDAFAGYLDMRQKIRKPMTDRAKNLLIKDLDALRKTGHDQVELLNIATMKNWLGVYAPKTAATGGSPAQASARFIDPATAYSGPDYDDASSSQLAAKAVRNGIKEAA